MTVKCVEENKIYSRACLIRREKCTSKMASDFDVHELQHKKNYDY